MKNLRYMSLTGHESNVRFKSIKEADEKWKDHLKKYGGWMKIDRQWCDANGDAWEYGAVMWAIRNVVNTVNSSRKS